MRGTGGVGWGDRTRGGTHYKKTAFLLLFLQKCVMSRVFQKHPTFARKRLLEDENSLTVTDNKAIKFREQVNVT